MALERTGPSEDAQKLTLWQNLETDVIGGWYSLNIKIRMPRPTIVPPQIHVRGCHCSTLARHDQKNIKS
jgi:hypothetical protein